MLVSKQIHRLTQAIKCIMLVFVYGYLSIQLNKHIRTRKQFKQNILLFIYGSLIATPNYAATCWLGHNLRSAIVNFCNQNCKKYLDLLSRFPMVVPNCGVTFDGSKVAEICLRCFEFSARFQIANKKTFYN